MLAHIFSEKLQFLSGCVLTAPCVRSLRGQQHEMATVDSCDLVPPPRAQLLQRDFQRLREG